VLYDSGLPVLFPYPCKIWVFVPCASPSCLQGIYQECAAVLYDEIDYINEGRNADRYVGPGSSVACEPSLASGCWVHEAGSKPRVESSRVVTC
jgi:hypothetical protein